MQTFTDNQNDPWIINVTFNEMEEIKAATGADFLDVVAYGEQFARMAAGLDIGLALKVLAVLCAKQMKERGLDAKAFYARLTGEAIERATAALLEAVADFFPPRVAGKLREALAKVNAKLEEAAQA